LLSYYVLECILCRKNYIVADLLIVVRIIYLKRRMGRAELGVRSLKNDYIPEQPGAIYDLAFFIHM
jgi:hypothetical protein